MTCFNVLVFGLAGGWTTGADRLEWLDETYLLG